MREQIVLEWTNGVNVDGNRSIRPSETLPFIEKPFAPNKGGRRLYREKIIVPKPLGERFLELFGDSYGETSRIRRWEIREIKWYRKHSRDEMALMIASDGRRTFNKGCNTVFGMLMLVA